MLIAPAFATEAATPKKTIQDERFDAPTSSPLGRYERAVETALQASWLRAVNSNRAHLTHVASAKVYLSIRPDGQFVGVRYTGPGNYPALKATVMETLRNAKLPAMSPALVAALPASKKADADFTFKLY